MIMTTIDHDDDDNDDNENNEKQFNFIHLKMR